MNLIGRIRSKQLLRVNNLLALYYDGQLVMGDLNEGREVELNEADHSHTNLVRLIFVGAGDKFSLQVAPPGYSKCFLSVCCS